MIVEHLTGQVGVEYIAGKSLKPFIVYNKEKVYLPVCDKCGGIISYNLEDYVLYESTCDHGCCHYSWRAEIKILSKHHMSDVGDFCENCLTHSHEVLRDKLKEIVKEDLNFKKEEVKKKIRISKRFVERAAIMSKEYKEFKEGITPFLEEDCHLSLQELKGLYKFVKNKRDKCLIEEYVNALKRVGLI